jgi:hypothetical protein
MKRFMDRDEWREWVDAGKPKMSDKQVRLACRSVTLAFGNGLKAGDKFARKVLADRDREAGVMTLAAGLGEDAGRAAVMLADDVDPELRALWIDQLANPEPASVGSAPLGMDPDRYRLHTEAKQLAQRRCDANPRLDASEAYALAAIEIEDRKTLSVI